jgi:hypothetical protein
MKKDPLQLRGADWLSLSKRAQTELLKRAFHYWRENGFPYYNLSEQEIDREFSNLQACGVSRSLDKTGFAGSNVGLRLANNFHPQMWSVRVSRYRSPMDVFKDDELLAAALERAWRIWPDRYGVRPSSLRRILKSFPGTAAVSNFRPTLSRAVIAVHSCESDTIVDFASGYGGRLVGCVSLNRHYVGIEPCHAQVVGLKRTIDSLSKRIAGAGEATIMAGCAEDLLITLPSRSAKLVFSSPPYYDWERYSDHPSQSFVRYPSYQDWLMGFLAPVVHESRRILKSGGKLILNVSGRQRYPTAADVQKLARNVGFAIKQATPILITRIPYLHPRNGCPYKPELLLIFHKR